MNRIKDFFSIFETPGGVIFLIFLLECVGLYFIYIGKGEKVADTWGTAFTTLIAGGAGGYALGKKDRKAEEKVEAEEKKKDDLVA